MKISELHLREYARVDSSMAQTFTAEQGWSIELRADLGGVILGRANRIDPKRQDQLFIPLANIRNATPVEVPPRAGK